MKSENFQPALKAVFMTPCMEMNKDLKSASIACSTAIKPFKDNIEFGHCGNTLFQFLNVVLPSLV